MSDEDSWVDNRWARKQAEEEANVAAGKCKCGNTAEPEHECPYNEIEGNTYCNCCVSCMDSCARDI